MEKEYDFFIKATPSEVWDAITGREVRGRFQFGAEITSDWLPDSRYEVTSPAASLLLIEGVNLEVDPPRRLVQSALMHFNEDVTAEGTSRVTWEIEPVGSDSSRLLVVHDEMREGANPMLYGGWPMILSGLKTWLETGEELTTPGSLMYRKG